MKVEWHGNVIHGATGTADHFTADYMSGDPRFNRGNVVVAPLDPEATRDIGCIRQFVSKTLDAAARCDTKSIVIDFNTLSIQPNEEVFDQFTAVVAEEFLVPYGAYCVILFESEIVLSRFVGKLLRSSATLGQ